MSLHPETGNEVSTYLVVWRDHRGRRRTSEIEAHDEHESVRRVGQLHPRMKLVQVRRMSDVDEWSFEPQLCV